MMYSGSLLPCMDVAPRMRMDKAPSTVREIHTPGYLLINSSSTGTDGVRSISSPVTAAAVGSRGTPLDDLPEDAQPDTSPASTANGTREWALIYGELKMDNWIRFIGRSLIAGVASITMVAGIAHAQGAPGLRVTSPDGKNSVLVEIREGYLVYSVQRQGRAILLPSRLGMEFKGAKP